MNLNIEERRKEYAKKYYQKNKAKICRYKLREGYLKAVERDKSKAFCKAKHLMKRFPYEDYVIIFKKAANRYGIYDGAYARQECEEAAIAAYMYSIYRCAAQGYEHVDRYIKKMIWIFSSVLSSLPPTI